VLKRVCHCEKALLIAGMIALRSGETKINHEHFMDGILEVQMKKKASLQFYA
jgi:26S proteasome regulatory subunit T5